MMLKIVSLFLIFMVVLAMFGRLRWPGPIQRLMQRRSGALPKPRKCQQCGRFDVTGRGCPSCQKGAGGGS